MKNINIIKESVAGIIILAILMLFLNPFDWQLSQNTMNIFSVALLVIFFIFAFFICHRKNNDERDEFVLLLGERFGFIAGCTVLLGALIFQSRSGELDQWLVISFIVMVLAKIIGMIYAKMRY